MPNVAGVFRWEKSIGSYCEFLIICQKLRNIFSSVLAMVPFDLYITLLEKKNDIHFLTRIWN